MKRHVQFGNVYNGTSHVSGAIILGPWTIAHPLLEEEVLSQVLWTEIIFQLSE